MFPSVESEKQIECRIQDVSACEFPKPEEPASPTMVGKVHLEAAEEDIP